jgi:hypothetical protein
MVAPAPLDQQIRRGMEEERAGKGLKDGTGMTSFVTVDYPSHVPPTMKMHKRWDYLTEYIDFYKMRYTNAFKAIIFFAGGILTLNAFAPGALLMIALAARHADLAWWGNFISTEFGKYRSVVLID